MHFGQSAELENTESDAEVFLRILSKVVDELGAFAGELIEVWGSLVDVIEEGLVGHKLAECAFSGLGVRQDRVDLGCSRIKSRKGVFSVVIDLFVFQQPAERSAPCAEVAGDQFE